MNLRKFIESDKVRLVITGLIVINAAIFGLQTSKENMAKFGSVLTLLDNIILWIFVLELTTKIFIYRWKFFLKAWNLFDFFVVGIGLLPSNETFAVIRVFRVLRILRLISAVDSMKKVVEGLLRAIPGIASVALLMLLFFYVFSILSVHLYGESFPEWFGSLGAAMFTLFQVMTLESWSMGIVRPVLEVHPNAWLFFIVYILFTTFTMLNLFIAIILGAMNKYTPDDAVTENRKSIADNKNTIAENRRLIYEILRKTDEGITENRKSITDNKKTIAENKKLIGDILQKVGELKGGSTASRKKAKPQKAR